MLILDEARPKEGKKKKEKRKLRIPQKFENFGHFED